LDLSRNDFSSTLSPDIAKLTNLKFLVLDEVTGVTGTLPESLKTLTSLQSVRLEQSPMTAPIFDFVAHWPKLEKLDISLSQFTGTIPTTIGNLVSLQSM
jgi:hypothetical protein